MDAFKYVNEEGEIRYEGFTIDIRGCGTYVRLIPERLTGDTSSFDAHGNLIVMRVEVSTEGTFVASNVSVNPHLLIQFREDLLGLIGGNSEMTIHAVGNSSDAVSDVIFTLRSTGRNTPRFVLECAIGSPQLGGGLSSNNLVSRNDKFAFLQRLVCSCDSEAVQSAAAQLAAFLACATCE